MKSQEMSPRARALDRYRKTKRGVLTNIYQHQKERSKKWGFPPPSYTLEELHDAFLDCVAFDATFNAWRDNGYQFYDKPSLDRIDPLKPYLLRNLQVLTWRENRRKGDREKILTRSTEVVMCDMNGVELRSFGSTKEAASVSSCNQGLITMCCQGKRNHTGGYRWKYGTKRRCKNPAIYDNQEMMP